MHGVRVSSIGKVLLAKTWKRKRVCFVDNGDERNLKNLWKDGACGDGDSSGGQEVGVAEWPKYILEREVKAVESYDLKAQSGFCAESNKVYLTKGQSEKNS